MTPAKVLVGNVRRERFERSLEMGEDILFQKPKGIRGFLDGADAVLVVLEPDQSPREIAETILWTLR